MTAINFDLDKKIAKVETKAIKIGGVEHSITFNDDTRKMLDDMTIGLFSTAHAFDDQSDAFINDYSVGERQKSLQKAISDQRNNLMEGLDKLLGKGEGKRLYEFYGNSFTKLSAVVRELVKLQDQEDGIAKANADRKRQAKKTRYIQKRG